MGAGGSRLFAGRPGYRGKAEQCFRLDVRWMHRHGYLFAAGTVTCSIGGERLGSISYHNEDGALILTYSLNGEPRRQRVPILRTACHLGGSRLWFACPYCRRRVAVLYLRRGGFYCRQCAQVSYSSQSEDALRRALRRRNNLATRLADDFEKPKGMHWRTYERLVGQIEHWETQGLYALLATFDPELLASLG